MASTVTGSRADAPSQAPSQASVVERLVGHLRPLLNYARGEIRAQEALGALPQGSLTPEDAVDAALAEALDHADEAPADRLYPWLRRLVRRAIRREVEARRRVRQVSLEQPVGVGRPDEESSGPPRRLIDVLPDPTSPIPDQVVVSEEFQRTLAALLWRLPRSWREPFLMHVRDGLSLREVAKLEGLPVAEVRRWIEQARQFLRAHLAEEYEDTDIPPPTETLFELLARIEPTPEQVARALERLNRRAA